jgi:hypothetical protein
MAASNWPKNWPDITALPYAYWPRTIRVIDDEMKILIRLKIADEVPKAMQHLHQVLIAQGKTIDDLHELIRAWNNPFWRGALDNVRELSGKRTSSI